MDLQMFRVDGNTILFHFLGREEIGSAFPLACWSWQVAVRTPRRKLLHFDVRLPFNGHLMTPEGAVAVCDGRPNPAVARAALAFARFQANRQSVRQQSDLT